MSLVAHTFTAPSSWASFVMNGDDSGMEPIERAMAAQWIDFIGMGGPVSCDDAGFMWSHDAKHIMKLGADCQAYVFLKAE